MIDSDTCGPLVRVMGGRLDGGRVSHVGPFLLVPVPDEDTVVWEEADIMPSVEFHTVRYELRRWVHRHGHNHVEFEMVYTYGPIPGRWCSACNAWADGGRA